ncbi:hypothetical protein [Flavobacterium daejeonense]|uniref:hypothetical protein n=1 Tax=Flavobacterium daejeonense TaxID=350893 RepID=UPI000479222F|nr:hypothetical protein [Flavobacterium daejeonense]
MNNDGTTTIYGGMLNEVVVYSNHSSGGYGYSSSGSYSSNGLLTDPYFLNSLFWMGSGGYSSSGGYGGGGGGGYYVGPTYVAGSGSTSVQSGSGLDMTNVIFDFSGGNQPFNTQLNGILTSNSVIAKLLNSASKGNNSIMINIGQLEPNALNSTNIAASTHLDGSFIYGQGLNQIITLDSDLVTTAGMIDLSYMDYGGMNHSNLTAAESLVVILAHEAFHAYSSEIFYNSQEGSLENRVATMLQKGVSQEVVDIYYSSTTVNGVTTYTQNAPSTYEQNEHNYMKSSAFTYVNDALAEYRANN